MAALSATAAWGRIVGGREYQEDYAAAVSWSSGFWLLVLGDGMGGEAGGDKASRTAVDGFRDSFVDDKESDIGVRLRNALNSANLAIRDVVAQDPGLRGMGTTLVGLTFDGAGIRWISVGDSPLWLHRDGELRRLNEEHSVGSMLDAQAARGEITRAEAAASEERHQLLEAVMGRPIELIDAPDESVPVRPGDIVLLASDGVETCAEEELAAILSSADRDADIAVKKVLRQVVARNRKNQDNTTVMIVVISADEVENR